MCASFENSTVMGSTLILVYMSIQSMNINDKSELDEIGDDRKMMMATSNMKNDS